MRYRKTREEKLAEVAEKSRDIARNLILHGDNGTWEREDVWKAMDMDDARFRDLVFEVAKASQGDDPHLTDDLARELAEYLESQAEEVAYAYYVRHELEEDPSD